ncbi:MAG: disulfide reductase [Spirochaetes bacterium]|nr:MAG: disulfide reductase [Spirochaetota bacterium]
MAINLSREIVHSLEREKIKEIGNTNFYLCYQCGNCSAGCPCAEEMDILPHRAVRLAQLGQFSRLIESKAIWVCAACITCSVRCPRGVDIAGFMEACRQIVLRTRKVDHLSPVELDAQLLKELPQIALINNFRKFTG